MTTPASGEASEEASEEARITPDQVGSVSFGPSRRGQRGINEREVRDFLGLVQREIQQLHSERAKLIDENEELRTRLASLEAEGGPPSYTVGEAQEQAVNLLSTAQQAADRYVADAHAYSRDLTEEARRRGDEILIEARSRAVAQRGGRPLAPEPASVSVVTRDSGDGKREHLENDLEELRTFAEVCRTHLRAYLAALTSSVEQWESADKSLPRKVNRKPTLPEPPTPGETS